jgi:hypothetical protein
LPEAFPVPALTTTCDDEIDPLVQDGKYPFNTSSFDATILNGQTGMTVKYFAQNGSPFNFAEHSLQELKMCCRENPINQLVSFNNLTLYNPLPIKF